MRPTWKLQAVIGVIFLCALLVEPASARARVRVRRGQSSGGYSSGGNSEGGGYGGGGGNSGGYQNDGSSYSSQQSYKYEYGVYDAQHGTDFGQSEERNGQGEVRGQYQVRLPDGRLQIVTYVADRNGYRANVEYQDAGTGTGGGGYGPPGGGSGNAYTGSRGRNFVNIMRQINGRTFNQNY